MNYIAVMDVLDGLENDAHEFSGITEWVISIGEIEEEGHELRLGVPSPGMYALEEFTSIQVKAYVHVARRLWFFSNVRTTHGFGIVNSPRNSRVT